MGFRETVRPHCWCERRLRALREWVLLVGADLIPRARAVQVRLAVWREERAEFLRRLDTLSEGLPIAAQGEWELVDEEPDPESPERLARMLKVTAPQVPT